MTMPSDVGKKLGFFDRFASVAANFVARAWFFAMCLLLVLLWAPSYFVIGSIDSWQLIINTMTTIVTFLLVALLQNTQKRFEDAVQQKLNAIADGLADMMDAHGTDRDLSRDRKELRTAVGLEDHESA